MPYLSFALVCLIWSSSFLLMKKAGLAFGPLSVGGWRLAGGAAVLATAWIIRQRRWPLEPRHLLPLGLFALAGLAWPFSLLPRLVSEHGSGFIGMTVGLVPLLTILVSIPILGVYPTRRQAWGVLGGLACLGLMLADGLDRSVPWRDLALAATVPLSYALCNTSLRTRWFAGLSPHAVTLCGLALAALVLLPWGLCRESIRPGPDLGLAVAALAVLGPVCTGAANLLFNRLIQDHGPLFAGMVAYLLPVGAVVLGWLDREPVTPWQLAALAGVLILVAVVQYRAAEPPAALDPNP